MRNNYFLFYKIPLTQIDFIPAKCHDFYYPLNSNISLILGSHGHSHGGHGHSHGGHGHSHGSHSETPDESHDHDTGS